MMPRPKKPSLANGMPPEGVSRKRYCIPWEGAQARLAEELYGGRVNGFGFRGGGIEAAEDHAKDKQVRGLIGGGWDVGCVLIAFEDMAADESTQFLDREAERDGGFRFGIMALLRSGCIG